MERGMRKGIREGEVSRRERGLQKGKDEGRKERSVEMAKALLDKGMDISEISEVSGLPEKEIRELSIL
uniref:Transposase n=1 Tax=Candidatus Kentrum sp. TC TaxID=2126339 RepID=A0A450YQQ3_9GAMM|nr:MAG: conserved hypothetical protein (putative transposase or invertase) [Candidatus Kentron sp. TC]